MKPFSLKQIENWILLFVICLFPIALINSLPNPFVTPKLIFLAVGIISIFLLKAIRNLSEAGRGLVFHTTLFDIPVLLLTLSFFISGFLTTPNRMEAFWLPGTASFVIAGALLYFIVNQAGEQGKNFVRVGLLIAASIVSFFTLLVVTGILKSFTGLPAYIRSDSFNLLGSTLSGAIFLCVVAPIAVNSIFKNKNMMVRAASGVAGALIAIALVISLVTLTKNWTSSSLPGLANSWVVATESLKVEPLFGSGPGNYLSAFNRFIPLSYNGTDSWSLRFSNAQNYYLTVITETGLIGLAALVVLIYAVYRKIKSSIKETNFFEYLPLVILLVAFALFPASPSLVVLLFVLLALETKAHVVQLFVAGHENSEKLEGKLANIVVSIPVILIALFTGYLVLQATRGEIIYQKALIAITNQDGKGAYDTIRGAIEVSPYNDRYHITYAQLNLALANSLAQKKNITDDEKNTVSQLVQQAIREARSAVVLNQQRSNNWETLASIYRSVIPLAKGADQFAIQTYSQAISLDPVNPNLRVALGGIYYSLKRYEEAIDVFKLAVIAKPDLANTHYNLAIAYRDNGQYDKALAELSGALTLVPKDSKDYAVLKKEIENVQSKAPKKNTTPEAGDNLTAPTKIDDKATLNPQVEIPQDATPPSPQATPAPTEAPAQ